MGLVLHRLQENSVLQDLLNMAFLQKEMQAATGGMDLGGMMDMLGGQ